jgi:hypothetical protein
VEDTLQKVLFTAIHALPHLLRRIKKYFLFSHNFFKRKKEIVRSKLPGIYFTAKGRRDLLREYFNRIVFWI